MGGITRPACRIALVLGIGLPSHRCASVRRSHKNAEVSALSRVFGGCDLHHIDDASCAVHGRKRERFSRAQGRGETRTSGKRSDATSNRARPDA